MAQMIGGAQMTGKVGAQVHGVGGTVRRLRVATNKNSVRQNGARSRLALLSTQYRGLTDVEQNNWDQAALNYPRVNKAGISRRLTGSQMYVQCNGLAAAITGQLGKTTPIQLDYPSAPKEVSPTQMLSADEELLVSFSGTLTANERLVIYASRGQSLGTRRATGMKLIASLATADIVTVVGPPATYKSNLQGEYIAVFGNGQSGVVVFLEAHIININELIKRPAGSCYTRTIAF